MNKLNLEIVNISLKDAVMPKEFYWNELRIDCLNEALESAQPYQTQNLQIFAPQMPLSTAPLCVVLHVKNSSDTDKELRISKQLLCDCPMKKNRLRKEGKREKCVHKEIVEMRPMMACVKAKGTVELSLTFRYDILGQQEVHFTIVSSKFTIKMQTLVKSSEFDPTLLLIINQLRPVAINWLPAPQQTLWLYNPYTKHIKVQLISRRAELTFAVDAVEVAPHQLLPLLLTFAPNYVGFYEMEIEIVFNECRAPMKIYGECSGREEDLLPFSIRHNSPNYDCNSQMNPFVLHGCNLCISLPTNGFSGESLIGLQNNSASCIRYEWEDLKVAADCCEIRVEPKLGTLKPGLTKLFRVSAKSLGAVVLLQLIPIKCSIFRHRKDNLREYSLPDGYFEFTEQGYYEKPSNWSPNCPEFLQSVFLNVNIRTLNSQGIIKYAIMSEEERGEHSKRQSAMLSRQRWCLSGVPSITVEGDVSFMQPNSEMYDDERHVLETIISSMALNGSKCEKTGGAQKALTHCDCYATLDEHQHDSRNDTKTKAERKSLISKLMNDVLFDCITDISKEHRFIPSSW